MGIIAGVTPGAKCTKQVPRISVSSEDIAAIGRINIRIWKSESNLSTMKYESFRIPDGEDPGSNFDLLWKISWPLRPKRPGWSGVMQMVHEGHHPGKSSIVFMPMIDMNPTDMSCIYSTLLFVCEQAKAYEVKPIITFDQPLWYKAMLIIDAALQERDIHSVVLRLGGFHVEMSFLGAIGHIMAGSGIEELFEVIYAKNTVSHILSGKAVARAVRGHFLMDSALHALLLSEPKDQEDIQDLEEESEREAELEQDKEENLSTHVNLAGDCSHALGEAAKLFDKLMSKDITAEEIDDETALKRMKEKINEKKARLSESRTANLWYRKLEPSFANHVTNATLPSGSGA